jgi:hypothetical protein
MRRSITASLSVALVGLVVLATEIAIDPRRAALAYAGAFDFGVSTALGFLLFVMINHSARSRWFVVFRRLDEAGAATIPLCLVLFVPVALTVRAVFPWARPERLRDEHLRAVYEHARWWFRPGFFVARGFVYLLGWSVVTWILRRQSIAQDADGRVARTNVQRWVSSAAMPLIAVTLTLAAFDWFMSVVPAWFSTMEGLYVFTAGFSGAVGLTCVLAWLAKRAGLLPAEVGPSHFLAIGRVLLLAVILWAYIAFCTFLLQWIGNLPHEVTPYLQRTAGAWTVFSAILVFGHFVLPFLLLLSRDLKTRPGSLAAVGGWVFLMHGVDAYWLVVPSHDDAPSVLDAGPFLAVGGLTFAFGTWRFFAARPVPVGDPNLATALRYETH